MGHSKEELEAFVGRWLGFSDIEGTGPDPEIRILYGAEAAEAVRRAHEGVEDRNDNS